MIIGEGSIPAYDGEALSKKGLVVVTINYRLGIFGTLAHPELSRESAKKVSGNYALLDMVAAIKWTRHNIAAFGGDPARITLYGESAGGRAVSALSTSPMVRGDIHGVIAGDTLYTISWGSAKLADAERSGVEFTKAAGVASIGALRHMSSDELMAAASKYQYRQFEFLDDGWALSGDIFAAEKSGESHDIPILTGITADFSSAILDPVSAKEFAETSRKEFGKLADRFLTLYPSSSDAEAAESQLASFTDSVAWIHSEWAAAHTSTGHRAYLYLFRRSIPPPPNARTIFRSSASLPKVLGAYHTGEIPYAFDSLVKLDRPWTSVDYHLADIMSSYWVNFATKGDPNGPGLPRWPAYGDEDKPVMELGDQVGAIPLSLSKAKAKFWAEQSLEKQPE
jgi:para-nitrobenzyl esterase